MKDYKKIIGREVDSENRTIFVIENLYGNEERVLYSELDMKRVRNESKKEPITSTIVKKSDGTRLVLRSHDEQGNKIDDIEHNLKKDKFINPEKYDKKEI
jgi:hypothetical protein